MPRYLHGKVTETMDFETFQQAMEKGEFKNHTHRSFLAFLYWTGVRISEALERVKEDFILDDGVLIIEAPPKKGGERQPLELSADLPYVELIVDRLEKTKKGRRLWRFTDRTGERIVKRALGEKYYPHFLRLNRATRFLENPDTTIPEMMSWFGWKTVQTVNNYIGNSRRHIRRMSGRLGREIKES